MTEHVFMTSGRVEELDLTEILNLTAIGKLEWGRDRNGAAAVGTNVDYSMGAGISITRNLLEVRAGYVPDERRSFNYLRLTSMTGDKHYIDDFPNEPLSPLGNRVLRIALIAVSARNGRLSGEMQSCHQCGRPTGHLELYYAAHGIPGAIMGGSERVECVSCGPTFAH
jgi:hypothetical protein